MHTIIFTRVVALGAVAAFCLCAAQEAAAAGALNTANFVTACAADENVTDEPGFEDGKVTPKAYCECVAAEIVKNKLSQGDVDTRGSDERQRRLRGFVQDDPRAPGRRGQRRR
jgi:hypothetical protein